MKNERLTEFLRTLPDLGARLQGEMTSSDFTLDRVKGLLEKLGSPERKFPSIHIAGTNGKGSVSAFCAAALRAQGYRVGRFTSPHLRGVLEGIEIDGRQVTDDELEITFQAARVHLQQVAGWTQFEIATVLALLHFAREKVDVAVIEVGLGGRLDATNVITPLVCVITPIDFDHKAILGNTLAEIAAQKAGIIKPGVPVVMAPQEPEAHLAIIERAIQTESKLIEVGKDVSFERGKFSFQGQEMRVWDEGNPRKKTTLHIGLHGMHQIENAATAYAVLQIVNAAGFLVGEAAIQRGFAGARWPGRFEILQSEPPVILDSAHSPAAAQALRLALDDYFPTELVFLVIGVSADKDLAGLLAPLRDRIRICIATQSTHPRAMPAAQLKERLAGLGIEVSSEPDAAKALKLALGQVDQKSVVLCAGSVFLAENIRQSFIVSSRT